MGKLTLIGDVSSDSGIEEIRTLVANLINDVVSQVNGNITFQDNIKCSILDIDFVTANSDVTTRHKLNKTPSGYLLVDTNNPTSLYTGSVAADNQTITLQSNAVATTKVLVF